MKTIIRSNKNTISYKKLFLLVPPTASRRFMLAAVNAPGALALGFMNRGSPSAASLTGQITFVLGLFVGGLTMGTSILTAQHYGKGDMISIEKIFAYVIKVSFLISAIFFLAALFVPETLIRILTSEPQLISNGIVYLRIVAPLYLFTGISQVYLYILKNTGYTIKGMVIGSTAVVINIFLNTALIYELLFFPGMGAAGTTLATSVSRLVEMGWAYLEPLREKRARLHIRYCSTTEKNLVQDYRKYIIPILDDYLVWSCGFTTYSVVVGHLGSDAVATNSIANIAKNLIVSFCTGLGNDGGIIVGNELGIGNLKQAKEYGGRLCRLAVINGILSGVLLIVLTPVIVKVTTLSPQAAGYLKWMLILCARYTIGKSINMTTIAGIFPAGGDSKFGLICDAATVWAFAVPAGFLMTFVWDLSVAIVFLIVNPDEVVKLPTAILYYREYGWLENLTKQKRNQNR